MSRIYMLALISLIKVALVPQFLQLTLAGINEMWD